MKNKIDVTTRFGYLVNKEGATVGKYSDIEEGPLTIPEDYKYVEVSNQEELNQVILPAEERAKILTALIEIDQKSIRALRTKDDARIKDLEDRAVMLRQQLSKLGV